MKSTEALKKYTEKIDSFLEESANTLAEVDSRLQEHLLPILRVLKYYNFNLKKEFQSKTESVFVNSASKDVVNPENVVPIDLAKKKFPGKRKLEID